MPRFDPLRPTAAISPVSAELASALIIDTSTSVDYPVMYNPKELRLEQGNSFAEVGIPGLNASPLQYVRGKSRSVTMDLFFDSYEAREDVRAYTGRLTALLDKQPQTQAPPVLLFVMGRFQFRCVLVDAGQRFTMFLDDGTPVRCIVSVKLQEYVRVDIDIQHGVFFGSPTVSAAVGSAEQVARALLSGSAPTVHTTRNGDTLCGLAATYLGDPAQWRVIADANSIADPLRLVPGIALVIPRGARQ